MSDAMPSRVELLPPLMTPREGDEYRRFDGKYWTTLEFDGQRWVVASRRALIGIPPREAAPGYWTGLWWGITGRNVMRQ